MNKDLKNEYEELLDIEIPDLWSRIEPQLHEKPKKKTNRRWGRIYAYSGLAAACLCLAIVVPVIVRTMNDSKNQNDVFKGDFETESSGMADTSVAYDDAEAVTESNCMPEEAAQDKYFSDGQQAAPEEYEYVEAEDEPMTEDCLNAEAALETQDDCEEDADTQTPKNVFRLPGDDGSSMDIEVHVISISMEEQSVIYELEVAEADESRVPGNKQTYLILASGDLGVADSLDERISGEPDAVIKVRIRWDEETERYRILEIL